MFVEVNGVELHYEIVGEGEPLLWLHGFFGCGEGRPIRRDGARVFRREPGRRHNSQLISAEREDKSRVADRRRFEEPLNP
jgi:hypothetical protein